MTKKPKTSKKLAVNRQTVRQLSELELTQAVGGESEATCVTWKPPVQPTVVGCTPG